MTNFQSKLKTAAYELVIDSLDFSNYDNLNLDHTAIEKLYAVFTSEYGYHVSSYGINRAVREWLLGLPSSVNIPFTNNGIIEWCVACELLHENPSDTIIDGFCTPDGVYWVGVAEAIVSMFDTIKGDI